jgi:hypothetical protein
MKTKEGKITIKGGDDPEILKWANTLKYGTFPKVVIEILRWYEKNGLLVRGGVNHPDILPPQIPLNQDSIDTAKLNEILKFVKDNNQLLKSIEFTQPTENSLIDTKDENESQERVNSAITEPEPTRAFLDDQNDEPEPITGTIPFSPFKIYK